MKGVVAIDGKLMRGPSQCDGEHTRGKKDSNNGWFPPGLPLMEFL